MTAPAPPAAPAAVAVPAAAPVAPAAPPSSMETQLANLWAMTGGWVESHWAEIGISAGVGAVIYLALAWLRRRALAYRAPADDHLHLTQIMWRVVARTKSSVLAIIALRLVAGFAEPPAPLMRVIAFVFTIAVVIQAAIWAREVILGLIERRAREGDNETLANAMGIVRLLVSVALFAIAAIVVLDNLGVNVTGLIAGLGIGGIAIGLAAQGIFSDLFAALSIIFDRPFRRGETIKYDTTVATVERIGLKSTRLRSVNGEQLIISNTNLLGKEIANFNQLDRRRVQFAVGLVYQTSPAMLRALPDLLRGIIEGAGHAYIRSEMMGFGPSSLDFTLQFDVMTDDYDIVAAARTDMGITIFEALRNAGYAFAYPTQTTFTAAPDGRMVMPWFDPGMAVRG